MILACILLFFSAQALAGGWGMTIKDAPSRSGAEVVTVHKGTPAAKAGLQPGDVIVAVGEMPVHRASELAEAIKAVSERMALRLRVSRHGWEKDIRLIPSAGAERKPWLGIRVSDVPPGSSQTFGAVVLSADPRGPASQVGIAQDDVITFFQGRKIFEAKDLAQEMSRCKPGQRVDLTVIAQDGEKDLSLVLGRKSSGARPSPRREKSKEASDSQVVSKAYNAYRQKQYDLAQNMLRKHLKVHPNDSKAWALLGDVYLKQGRYRDSIRAARQRLQHGQPHWAVYASMGWSYYRLGQYQESVRSYGQAIELNPNDANVHLTMGTALKKLNRDSEAIQHWNMAAQLDPNGQIGRSAKTNLAKIGVNRALAKDGAMPAGKPSGLKATVTIGDFQVKAAGAGQYIGDGLREMFLTALHNSGYFIVVERMDIKGLAAEQALSRSNMAKANQRIPKGQMDVADLYVYGAVTEFDPQAKGTAFGTGLGQSPFTLRQSYKEAHMAVDFRVVDVRTGRILATKRIPGLAISKKGSIGGSLQMGSIKLPTSFGMFKNTPMELSIRDCIQKGTMYIINTTPEGYFRHQ